MHPYILQCSSSSYLDSESNELFQSLIYTHKHTHVLSCAFFRLPTFNSLWQSRNSRSLYAYLYMLHTEKVDDDRFHTLSIYSRASCRRISKNIYIHTCTRMWWYTNTDDYIIHLYNLSPSISQSNRWKIIELLLFGYVYLDTATDLLLLRLLTESNEWSITHTFT